MCECHQHVKKTVLHCIEIFIFYLHFKENHLKNGNTSMKKAFNIIYLVSFRLNWNFALIDKNETIAPYMVVVVCCYSCFQKKAAHTLEQNTVSPKKYHRLYLLDTKEQHADFSKNDMLSGVSRCPFIIFIWIIYLLTEV